MSVTDKLILKRLAIPPEANGPHIDALRQWVEKRQRERGMIDMSGGTWATNAQTLSHDERARAFMAFVWESERYAYRLPAILLDGGPVRKKYNVVTGRTRYYVVWRAVLPYVRYNIDKLAVSLCKACDRLLRRTNPYR